MTLSVVVVLIAVFLIPLLLLVREAFVFLHWKQSLGRMDRSEWTRRIASMREE